MSVKVMGLVWDLAISPNTKFVLLAYADHASHDGTSIFPSVKLVATKTGYKERQVQSITRELERDGYLVADGKGPKGTNRWRIPLDAGGVKIAPLPVGVQKSVEGGAEKAPEGVQPNAPEPSYSRHKEPSEKERAGKPATPKPPKASDFPDLVIFREVAEFWPPKAAWMTVIEAMQQTRERLPATYRTEENVKAIMVETYKTWVARGYNPRNLAWLTEWAVTGHVNGGPKSKETARADFDKALDAWAKGATVGVDMGREGADQTVITLGDANVTIIDVTPIEVHDD